MALSRQVWENSAMSEPNKQPSVPRPATTVLLLRPSVPGEPNSTLEVFMVVRHHQIDSFSGALVFPGGKLEAGETVHEALARELWEELGIRIGESFAWQELVMDYPHARVRLHFCKVYEWTGAFQMREQQAMAWESLPVASHPVLPGTVPVLQWFAAERGFTGPTHRD